MCMTEELPALTPEMLRPSQRPPRSLAIFATVVSCLLVYMLKVHTTRPEFVVLDYAVLIEPRTGITVNYVPEGATLRYGDVSILILNNHVSMEGHWGRLMELLFGTKEASGGGGVVNDSIISFPDITDSVFVRGKQKFVRRFYNGTVYVSGQNEQEILAIGEKLRPQSNAIEHAFNFIIRVSSAR